MANRIEVTKLQDGPRYLVYHVYLESDGVTGDIEDFVLLDPATENMHGARRFCVEEVTWGFNGFTARLTFNELVDGTPIWVLPPHSSDYVDFRPYGGLLDRSDVDGNGKLMISTTDFTPAGRAGSFVLKVNLHK